MGIRRKLSILVDTHFDGSGTREAQQEIAEVGNASRDSNYSLGELAATGAQVGAVFGGIAIAAKGAYEVISQGAELAVIEQQFNALNESIGGTEDSLTQLRLVTGGMISDAKLMSGASDLISLGIASNQEEMLQWSKVVGGLNLDLQVLGLTLANNSKARLDSLGLSLEAVNAKTEEFVKAGKSADEAFDLAVLDGLNARMELLGDATETSAGQLARATAELENAKNEALLLAAAISGPVLQAMGDSRKARDLANEAISKGVITQDELNQMVAEAGGLFGGEAAAMAEVNRRLEEYNQRQEEAVQLAEESAQRTRDYNNELWIQAQATNDAGFSLEAMNTAIEFTGQMLREQQREMSQVADSTNTYVLAGLDAAEASRQQWRELQTQNAALEIASQHYTNLNGFLGGLDGTAESTANSLNDLAVSIIDNALAAEVAAGNLTPLEAALSSINVQEGLGLIDEAQAEELRMAAEQFGAIEDAIGLMSEQMVSGGGITVEEAGKMSDAIGLVEEGVTASGEAIAVFATGGTENLEGLTGSFDTTYDSVNDLDQRVNDLKNSIIDGLPDEKVITIRINQVGSVSSIGDFNEAATATSTADQLAR